ncbi:hypothetical protein CVT24_013348 [Panaeolus cyanescens]|uniref:Uncharacterized protein n=1 Tax=Panaeolus cyanescens TaxID=181874 RepID=A0A409YMF4_9AGAR|nr:hypothetical protein CVT24_013348 [Panaeolus cyanescens]
MDVLSNAAQVLLNQTFEELLDNPQAYAQRKAVLDSFSAAEILRELAFRLREEERKGGLAVDVGEWLFGGSACGDDVDDDEEDSRGDGDEKHCHSSWTS